MELAQEGDEDAQKELDHLNIQWRHLGMLGGEDPPPASEQATGGTAAGTDAGTPGTAGTSGSAPGAAAAGGGRDGGHSTSDVSWKSLTAAHLEEKPPNKKSATWAYFRCAAAVAGTARLARR